jgi:hypothetical protein
MSFSLLRSRVDLDGLFHVEDGAEGTMAPYQPPFMVLSSERRPLLSQFIIHIYATLDKRLANADFEPQASLGPGNRYGLFFRWKGDDALFFYRQRDAIWDDILLEYAELAKNNHRIVVNKRNIYKGEPNNEPKTDH